MRKKFLAMLVASISMCTVVGTSSCGALKGETGQDGKSAYAIAVENGFQGTEAEWLASLKGADGADGKDGIDGKDGVNGKDGADGADGKDGVNGKDGADGADGKDGVNGKDGANGADGKDGTDGKSAYEIAVEKGYSGTKDEWLLSLVGETGNGIEKIEVTLANELKITMTDGTVHIVSVNYCDHNYAATVTNPTCIEQGYTTYICENCDLSYINDYVPALGHHFVDKACHFCKIEEPFGEIEVDTAWYEPTAVTYQLSTKNQLAGFAYLVNSGNDFSGKLVYLADHIDLGYAEWIPIGTETAPFAGTFDGKYLSIKGLKVSNQTNYVGLFGYVTGGIKRVNILDANINVEHIGSYVGIACGRATSDLSGIVVDGYIIAPHCNYVGGVVGHLSATIQDCSSSASIVGASRVGGLVGELNSELRWKTISDLTNTGDVSGNGDFVGGIIGIFHIYVSRVSNEWTLTRMSNSGTIGGKNCVGGLFGEVYGFSQYENDTRFIMTEFTNSGDVIGINQVGGLIGNADIETSSTLTVYTMTGEVNATGTFGELIGSNKNIIASETL